MQCGVEAGAQVIAEQDFSAQDAVLVSHAATQHPAKNLTQPCVFQTNPAAALFPRQEDAAFAKSTLGVTFPAAVIAADSWWRYDPHLLGPNIAANASYRRRLADVNARLVAAGVDGCPTACMWEPHAGAGCNETARCGKLYALKTDDGAAPKPKGLSSGRSVRWWMGFGGQANNLALIDAHPKAFSGIYTYIGAGVETSGSFNCPHNASFLRKAFAPYWARGLTVTPALALTNASVTSGAAEKQVAQVAAFAKAINVSGLMLDFEPATSAIPWVEAYASYVAAFSKAMHAEELKAEMCVSSWGILDGHFLPNNEGYGIYAKTGVDTMMSMAGTYYGNSITKDLVNVDLELKQNVSISQLAAGIGTQIEPKISASCPTVKPMGCKIAGGQCYNWTETKLTSFIASLEKRGVQHIDFWRADIDEEGVCTEPWYFAAAEKFLAGGK